MKKNDETYLSSILKDLVPSLTYKPNWKLYIEHEISEDGSGGWHFFVVSSTEDSLNPGMNMRVRHGFLIPAASYNRNSWAAWLFDRLLDVETHEAGEFFKINGIREFAPHHGNGENPYIVWHVSDYATANKSSGDD